MNTYNDLKKSARESIEKKTEEFLQRCKIQQITVGISGEKDLPALRPPTLAEKKKIQHDERMAIKAAKQAKKKKKKE